MNVKTYITNDVNYGGLYDNMWGSTVSSSSATFSYGDVVGFDFIQTPKLTCQQPYQTMFNGWFIFDADDVVLHKRRLVGHYETGDSWTMNMKLTMNYTGSVIVVAEVT